MDGLRLEGVYKDFGSVRAVERTDLDLAEGALTALLGPSGCGKTTLLRMIAGLEAPTGGVLRLRGVDITGQPAHQRRFGMVFQNFALFPHLSVLENVVYSLMISGSAKAEALKKGEKLLDLVQLSGFGARRIGELSGGQRQRVAIARALAQEPQVFLLDEPMSALDAKLREDMQVELRLLQQRLGITTIVVTHDQREAMTMADKIVVMSQGKVEQVGPPQEIYHHPCNAFVADFIGKANFFDGVIENGKLVVANKVLETTGPAKFIDGAGVRIACRPEVPYLDSDNALGSRLGAKVTFIRDVGPARDVYLDTEIGPMIVEYARGENPQTYRVGQTATVTLPPDGLHVFPTPKQAAE
ncbi:MAG: ABC transporter ATP-binding protein [Marinibacterium sp.]